MSRHTADGLSLMFPWCILVWPPVKGPYAPWRPPTRTWEELSSPGQLDAGTRGALQLLDVCSRLADNCARTNPSASSIDAMPM